MGKLLEKVEACRQALGHGDDTALVRLVLREVEDELRRQKPASQPSQDKVGMRGQRMAHVLLQAKSAMEAVQHELATKGGYVTVGTRDAVHQTVTAIAALQDDGIVRK